MFLNRLSETGINESPYYASHEFNHAYPGNNWLPNCTAYAMSRVQEGMEAKDPVKLFKDRDPGGFPTAKDFYSTWNMDKGQEPKVGSILCWGKSTDKYGHVAYVEEVSKNTNGWHVKVSQSNFGGAFFETKEYDVESGKVTKGVGYLYQGSCYSPINDLRTTRNRDRLQVEIFGDLVRVRKSPNGEAYKGLYCPKGLYNIIQTAEVGAYAWAMLSEGYWIATSKEWATLYPTETTGKIAELEAELTSLMSENANLNKILEQTKTERDGLKNELKTQIKRTEEAEEKVNFFTALLSKIKEMLT